ncbi:DUF6543 domain-containing protein [Candidatus Rhabdochlamydia sp. T3358]|uniref:dermonecrotic toxin domain-containing protein n=1 Tax=Candidatus Rhabdochlamydia sp. T3358 TaxID=2099795 RepID=UPI0010B0FD8E|nr:DUF6543 domain-containing protein [Candidatus Rhabdochlamydia sp. T3358]VHO03122.1 hypothetical protein RHT_00737 [Candidatus Rhabdochlamydia sp. T3358]
MELNAEETKLSQIPESLRLLAKETLKAQINLDSDKTYINIAHGTTVSSENLTDALLKKSIGEESLLSHPLARLYSSPESTNLEDQIQGLEIENVKTLIDQSIPILIHAHFQQLNALWESNAFSPLQELLSDPVSDLLKALVEKSSLVERVYQIDSMYPNLKQSVTSYFSQKLRTLYGKDIHPDAVNVLFFKKEEENSFAFLSLTLTKFILNYFSAWFFYSYYLSEQNIIQVKLSQDAQNIALSEIFQASDITAIKSKHQERLGNFWQKNTSNYRILAKFSYLKTLLEQQNSASKLSFTALELACQAMGFDQENIKRLVDINEISLEEIPLNILEVLSDPKQVEVSSFLVNDQISSDILKVCDPITKHSLLYIPGYTPSFIEAKDERVLNHWVLHQAQLPTNLSSIASHFPHSSRMINNIKLDAFLYQDYRVRENLGPIFTKKDIFSFITEKQKERIIADLHVHEIPISFQYTYFPNYKSTDSAFFTTITAAIEYIPYLFPNIHNRAYDLHELFPLPQETAVKLIKKEVKDKLHLDIDPDKTFIGYFIPEKIPHSPGESPSYKMLPRTHSLTEATLSNYRIGFTLWSSSTIVFTDSSGQGKAYPLQSQLLNILPKDIEEIIQKIDLETLHKNKLNAFWNKHVDRVKFFVKHRYLQQALQEYHNNTLSEENFKIISEAAFYSLHLEEEGVAALINPNMRIEIVSIANYQSTDITPMLSLIN